MASNTKQQKRAKRAASKAKQNRMVRSGQAVKASAGDSASIEQVFNKAMESDSYKELFDKAKPLAYQALIKAHSETDKKNLADWEKKGLKAIVYSPEELKIFEEVGAAPVWKAWVTENAAKGVPAQELLDLILNEAQKAKAKLKKS